MECWAKDLGGCEGPQSGEHYISKSLFSGKAMTVQGLKWCKTKPREIPLATAKANILCKRHNSLLSDTDDEISRLQTAYVQMNRTLPLDRSGRLKRAPKLFCIRGALVVRWLAKTYCNIMTIAKKHVHPDFVRVAFDDLPVTTLYSYIYAYKGLRLQVKPEHVTVQDLTDDAGEVIWFVKVAGFPLAIATLNLASFEGIALGDDMIPANRFFALPIKWMLPTKRSGGRAVVGGVLKIDLER